MQSRRLSFRLFVPAVVICCLVTLLAAVPAAAQSKSGSDGSGDDQTLWSLMPPWVREQIAHIERLREQGAATGEAGPEQLDSDREALLSFARLYVRLREQSAATGGEAAPGQPADEPDGPPPERQPLDPATETRIQDSEREALLSFARDRVAVGDSPEQVRQAVEEEIRRRAEEARKDLGEWERRRGDADENFGKAVKSFEGERSPVGTYPPEEPFDRVIRTSAWETIVKEKVEAAEARSRVTDANAARAPDLAQEIAEQVPPRPESTLADDEIDDLVAFARKRLDEGMAGADVVEAVQAHIDDRAEKARRAVEHWAEQADAEAQGDGAPSESATASRHTAWERRFMTEANAADPGFAESIVVEAGGDPEQHGASDEHHGDDGDHRDDGTNAKAEPDGEEQPDAATDTDAKALLDDAEPEPTAEPAVPPVPVEVPGPWRPDADDAREEEPATVPSPPVPVVEARTRTGAAAFGGNVGVKRTPPGADPDGLDQVTRRCMGSDPPEDCVGDVWRDVPIDHPVLELQDDVMQLEPCGENANQPGCRQDPDIWIDPPPVPVLDPPETQPGYPGDLREGHPDAIGDGGMDDCLTDPMNCPTMMVGEDPTPARQDMSSRP